MPDSISSHADEPLVERIEPLAEADEGSLARVIDITDPDQDRYARLRLLPDYRQDVVARARVLVVGAGALGNEVLKNLALLGVGQIYLIDLDTIEASNLTRSVLFRYADRGRAKADVAADRVRALNPDVRVIAQRGDVVYDLGLGVLRRVDLALGCLDNREARLALNRACWHTGTPWIDGALNMGDGAVRVFVPPDGACYECLMTRRDYELLNIRYACPPGTIQHGLALTTPMSASIIAAMQVQQAIKLLHGHPVTGGQGVTYSGVTLRTTRTDYPRRAACPVHDAVPDVVELPLRARDTTVGALADAVRDLLDAGDRPPRITLPDRIVTYFHCPACATTTRAYRPYRQAVPAEVPCPECGNERIYDLAAHITAHDATRDLPLSALGIPPLAVLEAQRGSRRVRVELSGDADAVLAGWASPAHTP